MPGHQDDMTVVAGPLAKPWKTAEIMKFSGRWAAYDDFNPSKSMDNLL